MLTGALLCPFAAFSYRLLLRDGPTDATPEALHQFMDTVLRELSRHEDAWPFHKPVDPDEVVDYHDIVKDPVDFSLIRCRLQTDKYYLTLDMFLGDLRRMFNNCRWGLQDGICSRVGLCHNCSLNAALGHDHTACVLVAADGPCCTSLVFVCCWYVFISDSQYACSMQHHHYRAVFAGTIMPPQRSTMQQL